MHHDVHMLCKIQAQQHERKYSASTQGCQPRTQGTELEQIELDASLEVGLVVFIAVVSFDPVPCAYCRAENTYVGRDIRFRGVTSGAMMTVCLRFSAFAHMLVIAQPVI